MITDEEKTASNAQSEAAMDDYLSAKSWVEKVESIERMKSFGKTAREAMKKTLEEKATRPVE